MSTNRQEVIEELYRTASLLMHPGTVHELRIPKAGKLRTVSGYFDDPSKLARAAAPLDRKYAGIYVTLNPCNPALLARAQNHVKEYAAYTTTDADIIRRHWLLIDCDPKRPAGISSTHFEHARAVTVACSVWDDLHSDGWPDPVVADSGNGCHLLYAIDDPNDAPTKQHIESLLKTIARCCAPEDIDIDVNVYNAARITKLYGTMTCKGESTADRPHRPSRILEIPQVLKPLQLEMNQRRSAV